MGKEADKKLFTWVIRNFCSLQSMKVYSDEFVAGGCKWRLLPYPKGNGCVKCLSLYLEVAGSQSLPYGWRRRTEMYLSVVNQVSNELSQTKVTYHWFDAKDFDRGFTTMLPLDKIYDKDGGFLVNGDLKIVADVYVLEAIGKLDAPDEFGEESKSVNMLEEDDGAELVSVNESMDVNGFQVLPSQVETMSRIFERHPDIASKFRPKNEHLRTAYINVLLSLIKTLCQSTQEISKDDLTDAYASLSYLTKAGLNLDWLKEKLEKMSAKKEKQEAGEKRMQEIEEELKDLKQKCLNLEAELEKEKADVYSI